MRFAIAYSRLNSAGTNIVNELKKMSFAPQIPIIELEKETIFSENINSKKYPELRNTDFLVFASTHKSEKNFPSLCLHAPGNWRNADLGGKPGKICKTSAFLMKYLFQELNKNYDANKTNLNQEYNITLEVTHHGPFIEIPCCFIELGSNEQQWNDLEAAKIVAKTILSLQDYPNHTPNENWIPAIGIGGPHYAPNFNKIQLNSNYAISHIIPEYAMPVTESMLREAEQKTHEQTQEVILDWKGCGKSEDRQKLIELLKNMGFKYKRSSEIEKE